MNETYVPFGGKKHIVRADCRLCGYAPSFCGDVVFRRREELDAMIAALTELQNGWDDPLAHIHLMDHGFGSVPDPTCLEVMFSTPAWSDADGQNETRESLVDRARKALGTFGHSSDQVLAVLEQLARGPAIVRQLINDVPPELQKRRPGPGVWSAHEHAVHLPAVHPIMLARMDLILREPGVKIKSYEPSRDDDPDALLKLDLDAEMDRFERDRAAIVERLRKLTPEQWAIAAEHEEYSRYGMFIMWRHIALHDLHHGNKIEERLLRKDWA